VKPLRWRVEAHQKRAGRRELQTAGRLGVVKVAAEPRLARQSESATAVGQHALLLVDAHELLDRVERRLVHHDAAAARTVEARVRDAVGGVRRRRRRSRSCPGATC
jgi:hypothetical protein